MLVTEVHIPQFKCFDFQQPLVLSWECFDPFVQLLLNPSKYILSALERGAPLVWWCLLMHLEIHCECVIFSSYGVHAVEAL